MEVQSEVVLYHVCSAEHCQQPPECKCLIQWEFILHSLEQCDMRTSSWFFPTLRRKPKQNFSSIYVFAH